MTSDESQRVYVWTWLGGRTDPVVAGALDVLGEVVTFTYGRSYLERDNAVSLHAPELPLQTGQQRPEPPLTVHGCIRDAGPDAWGQRVVLRRLHGGDVRAVDTGTVPLLTYLLESGSDRIGALDFQRSATEYVPRRTSATLAELLTAAERLEAGEPFSPALDEVLNRGTSVGGARPKALLDDDDRQLIAKFSSITDTWPVVRYEAVAMELARRVGLDVATTELVQVAGRDVLLVDRFDRIPGADTRTGVVSALTLLGLSEMMARYASYPELADEVRRRFAEPESACHELFRRLVFNVLVSNTDDHARNHAALWDGEQLRLSPAYDLCPQARTGGVATQAMAIDRDGTRDARLQTCIDAAEHFLLDTDEARDEADRQLHAIRDEWDGAADDAALTAADRRAMWRRQIINPYALEGLAEPLDGARGLDGEVV